MPNLDHLTPEQFDDLCRYVYDRWPMYSMMAGKTTAGKDYPWGEATEEHRATIKKIIKQGLEAGDTLHLESYESWCSSQSSH